MCCSCAVGPNGSQIKVGSVAQECGEKNPTTKLINGYCEKREAYKESELRSINLSIFSTTYMLQIGIQQLSTGIHLLPFWSNQSTMQFVHVCKINHGSSNPTAATVTKSITITEDLSWSVNVHDTS